MAKVLVTGGAGFIGSHAVDAFLADGLEVVVLDKKPLTEASNLAHVRDKIAYCHGDIRNPGDAEAAAAGCALVLHLAAEVSVQKSIADPSGTHETNVVGTQNVFHAARRGGAARVVYASSAAVYGDTPIVPTHEAVPHAPLSPYGEHKSTNEIEAALWAREFGIDFTGLRFFNVYGSRQDPSSPYSGVISIFSSLMKAGTPPTIYGDGSATRDFIHVSDVVRAAQAALTKQRSSRPVYNVATGQTTTITGLVETLNSVLGTNLQPRYELPRSGDIVASCAVNSAMQELVDTNSLTPLPEGLKETVGYTAAQQ